MAQGLFFHAGPQLLLVLYKLYNDLKLKIIVFNEIFRHYLKTNSITIILWYRVPLILIFIEQLNTDKNDKVVDSSSSLLRQSLTFIPYLGINIYLLNNWFYGSNLNIGTYVY